MAARLWLSRTTTVLSATLLAGIGAAVTAAPASAATTGKASVSNTHISFVAGSGKANRVVITRSRRTVTIDDKYAIKAGKGCKTVKGDNTKVRCTPAGGYRPRGITVHLGDKSDKATNKTSLHAVIHAGAGHDVITGGHIWDDIYGESGNDTLRGGRERDRLFGGAGNDELYGGSDGDWLFGHAGNDILSGGSGADFLEGESHSSTSFPATPGKDVFRGGSGIDTASYGFHPRAVSVDLDGRRGDDGMPGEGDTVGVDVETILGSAHADTLIGNGAANYINGLLGADEIWGLDGNDELSGHDGNDELYGGAGDDNLLARELGSPQPDVVDGGSNATSSGDRCEVAEVDVVTGCERIQS